MSIHNATCQNEKCKFDFYGQLGDNAEVPNFCPECGSPVIEQCPNEKCKADILEGIHPKFCQKCGTQLRFRLNLATGKLEDR
jgi:hypothetical protein